MSFNPYARQIKFAQAVNNALTHHVVFSIFRTVEGTVRSVPLRMVDVDLKTGDLLVVFNKDGAGDCSEKASELDLQLISQRARQLEQAQAKKAR